jgi:hypothetical protein
MTMSAGERAPMIVANCVCSLLFEPISSQSVICWLYGRRPASTGYVLPRLQVGPSGGGGCEERYCSGRRVVSGAAKDTIKLLPVQSRQFRSQHECERPPTAADCAGLEQAPSIKSSDRPPTGALAAEAHLYLYACLLCDLARPS